MLSDGDSGLGGQGAVVLTGEFVERVPQALW
jgi:hypothetical protein